MAWTATIDNVTTQPDETVSVTAHYQEDDGRDFFRNYSITATDAQTDGFITNLIALQLADLSNFADLIGAQIALDDKGGASVNKKGKVDVFTPTRIVPQNQDIAS